MKALSFLLLIFSMLSCGQSEMSFTDESLEKKIKRDLKRLGSYNYSPADPRSPRSLGKTSPELVRQLADIDESVVHILSPDLIKTSLTNTENQDTPVKPYTVGSLNSRLLLTDKDMKTVYEASLDLEIIGEVFTTLELGGVRPHYFHDGDITVAGNIQHLMIIDSGERRYFTNLYGHQFFTVVGDKIYAINKGDHLFTVFDSKYRILKRNAVHNPFGSAGAPSILQRLVDTSSLRLAHNDGLILLVQPVTLDFALYSVADNEIIKTCNTLFEKIKILNAYRLLDRSTAPQVFAYNVVPYGDMFYLYIGLLEGPVILEINRNGAIESAFILAEYGGGGLIHGLAILPDMSKKYVYIARNEVAYPDHTVDAAILRYRLPN